MSGRTKPANSISWRGNTPGTGKADPGVNSSFTSWTNFSNLLPERRTKFCTFLFGCFCFLLCQCQTSPVISAELYRWVDDKGNVHFGDRPPDSSAEKIIVDTGVNRDPEYRKQVLEQARILEVLNEEREEKDIKQAETRQQTERHLANCETARSELEKIRTASYLFVPTDDPLNPRVLSNEEREIETARITAEVDRWCR